MRKVGVLSIVFLLLSIGLSSAQKVEVKQISDAEFKSLVWNYTKYPSVKLQSKLPVIVDFYATWCGTCKLLAPSIDKLLDEYKGKILIYRVDVDKDRALAEKMHIQAMPTLLFFDMKNTKSQSVGYMSYDELKREAIARLSLK